MVKLYEHNLEAFQEISKMLESGIKRIAAPRATGSGKTYLMGALAEQYNNDKKLVLEPTRPLLDSIKEKFDEFGIVNTDFITYQKLIRMSDEDIAAMDYKLIFLDECHHGTAPVWGQKTNYLMETHLDSIIFGTSATTVRNDGVNVVESLFEGNTISELPLSTAIARKVLPCPHYITAIYRLDDEFEKLKKKVESSTNTKSEKKEFYKKMQEMKLHFEKSYGVPLILNKYIKVKNGRYLVFCKNKKHLDTMRDVVINWFHTAGIKNVHSYAVYSDYPDKEKDYKEFCEDNSDSCKILFSINMLNEGLHIQDISGVLMLRTTQSNLIYLQQLGRLVDADNIGKYLLVFDFVNNFSSVNDGIGLLKEIKDAVVREKESDPDYDDSAFDDIDTFFVLENVIQIKEMFAEIEGRLIQYHTSFTDYEDEIIKNIFPSEGSKGCLKYIKDKNKGQINYRAKILGVNYYKDLTRKWNNEKTQYLLENYENTSIPLDEMCQILNMTKSQIRGKASRLKLVRRTMSEEEKHFIESEYPIHGAEYVSEKIGRSLNAIYQYASNKGIKGRNVNAIFTSKDDEIIFKYYPEMGSDCVIHLKNKTRNQVNARAHKLGIKYLHIEKKEKLFLSRCNDIENAKKAGVKITTTLIYNNIPLGSFVRQVRVKAKNNKLSLEQLDMAKRIGILNG